MDSLLSAKSADVATTLLSNIGHTVVIRVVLNALRLARRKTVHPAALEETISTLCLLSHRRYEGRIPELAVCLGNSTRRPSRATPAIHFGRDFLSSKKSAVLFKGSTLLLRCLGNARIVEVVDLASRPAEPTYNRLLGSLGQASTLNYAYHHGAVTVILSRQGEVLVSMGARICFSWDPSGWRVYPAMRLAEQLSMHLAHICQKGEGFCKHLAQHLTTIALTLRDDRLGALLVISSSEDAIAHLIRNRQMSASPVEVLYSRLFAGRSLCQVAPQLVCNAAALDGAVVVDGKGKIREIGCIFPTGRARIVGEGARTRAAAFASKSGIALKVSQDGEISVFKSGKSLFNVFAPVR